MTSKQEHWFYSSAGWLLLITAAAKLYAVAGRARVLALDDKLLHLGYRPLMILAAALEIVVALYLLGSRNGVRRSLVLLWLSANFLCYHLGNYLMGFQNCPCLGRLTDRLPLPRGLPDVALQVLVLFWLTQSLASFWRLCGSNQWAGLLGNGLAVFRQLVQRLGRGC